MNDLYELLREDALQLSSDFRKASIQGKGTSQEVAEFRENAVQAFLARYFPFPHRIAKGKVRDSFGNIAASIDCVICAPNHPYTVSSRDKFTLLLAEGVDSVVEVKPNIADKAELHRALEQGLTVKKLRRSTTALIRNEHPMSEWAKRVPFGVFAMQCKASPIETGFEILEFYEDHGIEPIDQADFVVVNDVCVFSNFVDKSLNCWDATGYPNQTGWFYEGWRKDSLAGFLLRLHQVAHAGMKLQEDILPRYLTPPAEARFRVVDLAYKYGIYKQLRSQPEVDAAEIQRSLRALTEES
ncbi:DUF6602 domain-containing protein [Chitinimonas taiwanensis]|uniref:DUF6602 domain-containing protein n=1 Tax=Chitinimonas taiwanensis DSM 18899 TaxID=1121279 RepID=A0A1K2HN77_9NEIS|nr:DUF6602 domain-containing protein [Chitinimonas taiwanensis]SFZ78149.1 hypothetical protein SAMN02745887_02820 [Chitinimonas taiwanensis DSM 18899]